MILGSVLLGVVITALALIGAVSVVFFIMHQIDKGKKK